MLHYIKTVLFMTLSEGKDPESQLIMYIMSHTLTKVCIRIQVIIILSYECECKQLYMTRTIK